MSNFQHQLAVGKMGESLIAKYFLNKGYAVLPVYEKETKEYKGPVLFMPSGDVSVAPDMFILKNEKAFWVEAKHKTAFAWHRNSKQWTTGIDKHHYLDYLKIMNFVNLPVWLLFLHQEGTAKDTPEGMFSPCGLFGNSLDYLSKNIDHEHKNWGKNGMVYWAIKDLKRLASLDEIRGETSNYLITHAGKVGG